MSTTALTYDVTICGMGPVGATLSLLLAKRGLRVCIVEKQPGVYPHPRAVHLDDDALRILSDAGISQEEHEIFLEKFERAIFQDAAAKPFFVMSVSDNRPFGFRTNNWFLQPALEKLLRSKITQEPLIDAFLACELESWQEVDGVIHLKVRATRQVFQKKTKWLVGCDGANSSVRKMLTVPYKDLGFNQKWIVIDTFLKLPYTSTNNPLPKDHIQHCDPARPTTYVPGAKGHRRWEFMEIPGESFQELDSAKVWKLLDAWTSPEVVSIHRQAIYQFHARIAEKWRIGKVLLAGDAAHQMPPFAGQGLCSGLRDVANLAWKLDGVISGKSIETLLDTYQEERQPHVVKISRGAVFLGTVIQTRSVLLASLRAVFFRMMSKIPFIRNKIQEDAAGKPPLVRGILGTHRPELVGWPFPQPIVKRVNGDEVPLDRALPRGFVLLSLKSFSLTTVRSWQIDAVEITQASQWAGQQKIFDSTGSLTVWFSKNQVDWVLLRPDHYIFDAGEWKVLPLVLARWERLMHLN
ncbi:MAG: bifunctional 3-(3-hydroxy-phenyl)propionate/3-hydroxycinnamic acid hydroxylase [Bacteroidota bacterium]